MSMIYGKTVRRITIEKILLVINVRLAKSAILAIFTEAPGGSYHQARAAPEKSRETRAKSQFSGG